MHIKAINTKGEYKCIGIGYNYPVGVYYGKGYGVVYRLCIFPATVCLDSVYLGFDRCYSQKLLLSAF